MSLGGGANTALDDALTTSIAAGVTYVVAEGGGGGDVNANRTAVGAWEKFTLVQ